MGFFTCVALVLITAKAFGFMSIGWLWCFAPVLVDVALGFLAIVGGILFSRKVSKTLSNDLPRL